MRKLLLSSTAVLALAACGGDGGGGGTGSSVPTTITVAGNASFDAIGATQKVHASVLDAKGRPVANPSVAWASNSAAVTVTPLGGDSATLTAASAGSASVTASVGSASGSLAITVAQVATALQAFSGNNQAGTAGALLATSLRVKLVDRLGNGISGQTISFAVASGGGGLSAPTAVTVADGTAAVNWTLGATNGAQSVTASFGGSLTTTFSATAVTPNVGLAVPFKGGDEAVMIGTAVTTAPAIRVLNTAGNPVAGIAVSFTAATNNGTVTGGNVTTDANGVATVGSWKLGQTGPNRLTATVQVAGYGNGTISFTDYGCEGGGGTGYAITLCFATTMTGSQRAAFENAAARWSTVITGDLPNETGNFPANDCGENTPALKIDIDDLVIFAAVTDIDGSGAILGQATPCYIRDAAPQTSILGFMQFDAADVADLEAANQLGAVILHEMGHVLGIGTLWDFNGLLQDPSPTAGAVLDTWFSGSNGIAGFDLIGGSTYTGGKKVPVENTGGGGTANSHWRESVLKNELMTGYLNSGGTNPLSQLTARSLIDLGYVINTSAADAFSLTLSLRADRTGASGRVFDLSNDIYHGQIWRLDRKGRRLPVVRD